VNVIVLGAELNNVGEYAEGLRQPAPKVVARHISVRVQQWQGQWQQWVTV
jgi:hypothetical protein